MASTEEDTRAMDLKREAAVIDNEYQAKKKGEIKAFKAEMEEYDLVDDDFLDGVKEAFGHWTSNDFKAAGLAFADFRNFVQNHGVYVKNHRVPGGNQYQAMVDTLAADSRLEWPRSAVITAGQAEPMRTHDPVLQHILGPSLVKPSFLLKPHHHDGAGIMLQHQPTMSEEGDTPAQQLARESQPPSQPPQQRQIAQTPYSSQDARFDARHDTEFGQHQPYSNQDAQFDSRLVAESGQQQPRQRLEMPFRTAPDKPMVNRPSAWTFKDHSDTNTTDKDQQRILQHIQKQFGKDSKYNGGDDTMSLPYRARLFLQYCTDNGLSSGYVCKALPTMMADGEPFDYCQDLRCQLLRPNDWMTVLDRMMERFETPAVARSRENNWMQLSLQRVAKETPDKPISDSIQALYARLTRMQRSLGPEYASPRMLLSRLINIFENHPATSRIISMHSSTVADPDTLIRMMIDAARAEERASMTVSASTDVYFSDRKYQSTEGRGKVKPFAGRSASRKPFLCFICKKDGCRWANHTKAEQEEHKRKWQESKNGNANQYVIERDDAEGEMDGTESASTDDYDDDAEEFITEHYDEPIAFTQFWTWSDQPDSDIGYKAVEALDCRRVAHALTARVEEAPDEGDCETSSEALITASRYGNKEFMGFIVDTGASRWSTCGKPQLEALQALRSSVELDTSTADTRRVVFGMGSSPICGSASIDTPIGSIVFHVIDVETPFLISLADMDRLGCYLDNIRNVVVMPSAEIPTLRRFGHAFVPVPEMASSQAATSFFTMTELKRLHRRFGHPSVERLYRLLTKAGYDDTSMKDLQQIRDFCHNCQMHQGPPQRFKFNLREEHDVIFNGTIIVDVAYIDNAPYLHVIDEATGYMAARWLDNMTAQHAWDALRECWLDTYLGPPDVIVHDQGTNFTSHDFRNNAALMGVKTRAVPTEAHQSIGKAERYHGMIKRAFKIVTKEAPGLSREHALQMAIKAINDTAGPSGIVPTLLVYGAYPRMSSIAAPGPSITKRAAAIKAAMKDLESQRARREIARAQEMRNGPDATSLQIDDTVLVHREKEGWEGPYKVRMVDGETITVDTGNGTKEFRSTSVRLYRSDGSAADMAAIVSAAAKRGRGRPAAAARQLVSEEEDDNDPLSAFAKISGPGGTIWLTAPAPEPSFEFSRREEIFGLLEKGVFEPVPRTDVPRDTRVFNGRFVDDIKNSGTAQAVEKSRFVVQAHNDRGKLTVLTQSPTIQRMSQRLLLCIAACRLGSGFQLLLRDISQAYVQSSTSLQRDVYVNPNAAVRDILSLPHTDILHILKPLYGVPEAGNHWFATYTKHHVEALGMTPSTYDACLMVRNNDSFGLVGLQTDDTLILADDKFAAKEEEELRKAGFLAKPRETLTTSTPLKFNGGVLRLQEDGSLSLSQESQVVNINPISAAPQVNKGTRGKISEPLATSQQYVAQRARGAYVASVCQPEAAFDLSAAAQHTEPTEKEIIALNERLEWQLANQKRGLRFVKLDEETIEVVVFTDAAFANNKDLSSQIGYVVAIRDASGKANIIHWSSTKCRRVTKSVLASELYALVHGFDVASCIKATMDGIYGRQIHLVICTDSKSIFDAVTRLGATTEKRLMIDLAMIRQSYERREIAELKWIAGVDNPADAMTKSKACDALTELINTNYISFKEKAWVERE